MRIFGRGPSGTRSLNVRLRGYEKFQSETKRYEKFKCETKGGTRSLNVRLREYEKFSV
jgi:hypothetical protein